MTRLEFAADLLPIRDLSWVSCSRMKPQKLETCFFSLFLFQVRIIGEGADDAGGVFDDTITEMCKEIVTEDDSSERPILVPTPNAGAETGLNRDKFIPNPERKSFKDLQHFWFLGKWRVGFFEQFLRPLLGVSSSLTHCSACCFKLERASRECLEESG